MAHTTDFNKIVVYAVKVCDIIEIDVHSSSFLGKTRVKET